MAAQLKDKFTIEIPENVDAWGKTLITSLNAVFTGIVAAIHDDTGKLTTQFAELQRDVIKSANEATDIAKEALSVANKNATAIDVIQRELTVLKYANVRLREENSTLKKQTLALESYSRRDNLIIRGIAQEMRDGEEQCSDLAKQFFIEKMNLNRQHVEGMRFVRCHRMGKYVTPLQNKPTPPPRPIIVRFCNYSERDTVWEARKFLGATPQYSINENFPRDTEYNRRKLYPVYKRAKKMDEYKSKISLRGDTLHVNSVEYTVNNLQDLPDNIHPRHLCYKTDNTTYAFGGLYSEFCKLSNWGHSKFTYDDVKFSSSEQAYYYAMAKKAKDEDSATMILAMDNPRDVKSRGIEIKGLNSTSWNINKGTVMKDILRAKFSQDERAKQELLDTGAKKLAESGRSPYFASGLSLTSRYILDTTKYTARNKMGEILEQLRTELIE